MKKEIATLGLLLTCLSNATHAGEGPVPTGIPHLDHVFLIMMENHGYSQIIDNPSAPYINYLARTDNLATNYYAIAHPSLNNYLEITGGSNFGVQSDNAPGLAQPLLRVEFGVENGTNTDNPPSPNVCPISGVGTDAAVPRSTRLTRSGPPGTVNIDGRKSYAATDKIVGKSIADQLAEVGLSWKSYQENLPAGRMRTSSITVTDSSRTIRISIRSLRH